MSWLREGRGAGHCRLCGEEITQAGTELCFPCNHPGRSPRVPAKRPDQKSRCPNCDQWQDPSRHDYLDCVNECAARGFAPKIKCKMTPSGRGGMDVEEVHSVDPDVEFDRLINQRDSGQITPEQFEDKSRRLFGSVE